MQVDYSPDPSIRYKSFTNAKHMNLAATAYSYAKHRNVMLKYIADLQGLVSESNEVALKVIKTAYEQEVAKLTESGFKLSEEEIELNKHLEASKLEQELRDLRAYNMDLLRELSRKREDDNIVMTQQPLQVNDIPNTGKYDKLDSNTPIFHGKSGENIMDWLFVIENNFIKAKTPADRKLLEAVSFVRGAALQMLKNYMLEGKNSWSEFAKILKEAFAPIDLPRRVRVQLKELKHTDGMSLDQYVKKFLQLINQIEMTEE